MAKQPEGELPPTDGHLPESALTNFASTPFSLYLHVPFCSTRCGYCDFNTYTAEELGGASRTSWATTTAQEIKFAAQRLMNTRIATVFIGGGTPTLLPASDIAQVLDEARETFGFADDVEVTIEANPDAVDLEQLKVLRKAGVNRISFGMQSAVPHVLQILERTHNTDGVARAVELARAANFDNINIDLIYGTPRETLEDVRKTLQAVAAFEVEHVSAYALIVEDGTSLARRVRQGVIPAPEDDDMADKYELIDNFLSNLGMQWYELSNWSKPGFECRHNVHYWQSHNWWGVGPGAHSHIGGVRWWNAKHPTKWTEALEAKRSPAVGREVLTGEQQVFEKLLLQTRLRSGFEWQPEMQREVDDLVSEGLIEYVTKNRAVLTLRGRLLADAVVRRLTY